MIIYLHNSIINTYICYMYVIYVCYTFSTSLRLTVRRFAYWSGQFAMQTTKENAIIGKYQSINHLNLQTHTSASTYLSKWGKWQVCGNSSSGKKLLNNSNNRRSAPTGPQTSYGDTYTCMLVCVATTRIILW